MSQPSLCRPWEHSLSRRQWLGGAAALGAGALGGGMLGLAQPVLAEEMKKNDSQVLLVWLDGGLSQLESWDPKPNTLYGGPFRPIQTSVPGVQISELLPKMAKQMHRVGIVRSMKTADNSHSSGVARILRGDPKNRGVDYPYFGAAAAKLLGHGENKLPPYIWIKPGNGGFIPGHAGFLGAKYGALALGDGKPPENLLRPAEITDEEDALRHELRAKLNARYAAGRPPAASEANAHVFDVGRELMKHVDLFNEATLAEADKTRYGTHEFGKHMLLARRLLEAGVRCVQITSYGWDSHGDNFDAHASRVPKVDQSLAALLDDLHDRSMLNRVLVIVMGEFGRTPRINGSVGRDHWPEAWSIAMAGRGIKGGTVIGATNAEGTDVADRPLDIGAMFHTWFNALGIDSHVEEYMNGTQPLPIAHEEQGPVRELLA